MSLPKLNQTRSVDFQQQYELLDFGDGRKLERFGDLIVDRPTPVAACAKRSAPELWNHADLSFRRLSEQNGQWKRQTPLAKELCGQGTTNSWRMNAGRFSLRLRPSPVGQLGIFPEQAENWRWIQRQLASFKGQHQPRVLNLFAYTGGSTLAAATAEKVAAEVVHVDAAKNIVKWASDNAALSGLESVSIRWIVEDARRFVEREAKRGNRYDGFIVDPPSYGHGPKNEAWKIQKDLLPLLQACRSLLSDQLQFFLLTCHTPEFSEADLQAMFSDALFGTCGCGARSSALSLRTSDQRTLPAGNSVRWSRTSP
jgi:23S rRNA (cytosine1962-C5)-methyltransferase